MTKAKKSACKANELKVAGVCILADDIKEIGRGYGSNHSAYGYLAFDRDYVNDFIKKVFMKDGEPNWNFWEELDSKLCDYPPSGEDMEAMVDELANEKKFEVDDIDTEEDELKDLLRDGFSEGYDVTKDTLQAIKNSSPDVISVRLKVKHIPDGENPILVDLDGDEYAESVVESMGGAETRKQFLQEFARKILDKGDVYRVRYNPNADCYDKIDVNDKKEYLKKVIDNRVGDKTDFEECNDIGQS